MSSLNTFFRRATNLLGFSAGDGGEGEMRNISPAQDSEIIYCKNNVCTHPPQLGGDDQGPSHQPGYLTIRCHTSPTSPTPTLLLTWIPNSTLRRNPHSVESAQASPQRKRSTSSSPNWSPGLSFCTPFLQRKESRQRRSSATSSDCVSLDKDAVSCGESSQIDSGIMDTSVKNEMLAQKDHLEDNQAIAVVTNELNELSIELDSSKLPRPVTVGDDGLPCPSHWIEDTPESFALQHNLAFNEMLSSLSVNSSASPSRAESPVRRTSSKGIFTVDLGRMRFLRLFFSNRECTCGQLVIASPERQYKILHFHYGGLDRLAAVFDDWNCLLTSSASNTNVDVPAESSDLEQSKPYRLFMVCRPEVGEDELHPEEGSLDPVDDILLSELTNEDGQIEDELFLRKTIFFAGVDGAVRHEVWPFLFGHYPYHSTYEERAAIKRAKSEEYKAIGIGRESMVGIEKEAFWKAVQCTVEKDVIRTDRNNPFFAGDNNPNVEKMKHILLNYAWSHPQMGYTQGMSDLLAPVLAEMCDEADTFWCFKGLMHRTIFVSSPTDGDMDKNLAYLRELLRIMASKFYEHLQKQDDGMELLFCHRWILLCFKREFHECDSLRMWEACWSNYQTDMFHLFLCLAIVCIYGDDVVEQGLRTDETLLHFSSLALHMDGEMVLRKARGLLHQFRQLPCIPCTLFGLCILCGPGMWDSGHVPVVECIGHNDEEECLYKSGTSSIPAGSKADASTS